MTFTSIYFFGFVLLFILIYYLVPKHLRWGVLLCASILFYLICCYRYIIFILLTSLTSYLCGLYVGKETDSSEKKAQRRKKIMVTLTLVLNFGILAVLKYFNFFSGSLGELIGLQAPQFSFVLPLGISFYTFQSMGYVLNVHWGKNPPEENYFKFLLFVSFFPQIIQGPIAIYDELSPQLYEGHDFSYDCLKKGFWLFMYGLFKKLVIADRVIVGLNAILDLKEFVFGPYFTVALLLYSAQIYMDFSGGIDIARGVAAMLGIDMAENFKRPYFSRNVTDFWYRWHASLGNWIRTYLFYPMVLSKPFVKLRKKIQKKGAKHLGKVIPGCIGTIITFVIIGMWHGANWKYLGFGLWNGILLALASLLAPCFKTINTKLHINTECLAWRIFQIVRTYILMMLGFMFDIADGFGDGINMICESIMGVGSLSTIDNRIFSDNGFYIYDLIVAILGLAVVFSISLYEEKNNIQLREVLVKKSVGLQLTVTTVILLVVIIFGVYGPGFDSNDFVYMQF